MTLLYYLTGIKRHIGRKFDDLALQTNIKYWPYEVRCGNDGSPDIQVNAMGRTRTYCAEDFMAIMFAKMKKVAESALSTLVQDAVLTVCEKCLK